MILHGIRLGQFVAVNTCAVTDTLFESELFGHVRGSFTGADQERKGLIAQASNGTLFLDEIGDLPLQLQPKLLRVIQQRTYRKVGSNVDEEVKCRIIAATHQDLPAMVKRKEFRLDLYERLAVFTLRIKPLRERRQDIKLLWPGYPPEIDGTELAGNVRELLNMKLRKEVLGTL
jgi:transcriptional regulator with PAS, ATPase and Fis domain